MLVRPSRTSRCWTEARLGRGVAVGHDVHDAPATTADELDGAGRLGEQRVVLADPDAVARAEAGAALADDDLAAGDDLAGEHLHAEALGVGVAAVAGGAEALLVCHYAVSSFASAGFDRLEPVPMSVISMRVSS